jgi:hypothetical protein
MKSLIRPFMLAGKTLSRDERAGLERPLWSFGHKPLAKSGVAPAQSGVLPASKINRRVTRNFNGAREFRSPAR